MGTSNNIDYEMTTKHIYIDVWDPMENRVDVVQGEASARYVVAHIHHSGVPLNLEGASVQFYGTKPDGTGILNDCEVLDGKRGIVSIPMTQQMSIAPGEYEEAGLQIIRDGKVLKVLGLSIVVHPAYDYDEYLSEDELTAVQEAIDRSNYAASRIPSIGENGNWYLGEEDTGKPSRGKEGIRGRGLLKVSTAPTEESSTVDGYAYKYKFKLSTVLAESNASEVLVGDVLKYSYYEYGVGYVGASYAFAYTRTSIRGANGTSVTVSSVSESAEDGGSNVVNFSDGKSLTVKNGTQGSPGKDGDTRVAFRTKLEFEDMTSDDVAQLYADGIKMLIVGDGYTNLVPKSTDDAGNIYQGCGYRDGYRLTSSNELATSDICCVSGYMPYIHGSTYRIVGSCGDALSNAGQYIGLYDASYGLIKMEYASAVKATWEPRADGLWEMTIDTSKISSWSSAKYFRVSCSLCVGADLKVTRDELIGLEV